MNESTENVAVMEPVSSQQGRFCPPLKVRAFGLTDRGKVREANEDQFLIAILLKALRVQQTSLPQPMVQHGEDESHLFIVADGMGGAAAGEKASALALNSVESFILNTFKWFAHCKGSEQNQVLADFQNALNEANRRLLGEAQEHPELSGMGTTLTLAYSLNDQLFVAHVGDSRCYLLRNGVLSQLTHDHTLVDELVRQGTLRAEEAVHHHWRHVITNVVGGDTPEMNVEVHKVHLQERDRLLLCSDGLTGMVSDEEIKAVLDAEADPERACHALVSRTNENGGKDNVTVIVAFFDGTGER